MLVWSVVGFTVASGITALIYHDKAPAMVGNVLKDSGVKGCERIRAAWLASSSAPSTDKETARRELRNQFAGSRHADLRTSGPAVLDLLSQVADDDDGGAALLVMGALVQQWGALQAACGNHGVQIPSITQMGKNK